MKSPQASSLLPLLLMAVRARAQGYNGLESRGEPGLNEFSFYARDTEAQLYPRFLKNPFQRKPKLRRPIEGTIDGERGNKQSTSYNFMNAKFGDNAKMDMGVQNQAKGGAVQKEGKKRRSLDDYQLYIRDSDDEGMYSASREVSEEGGNNIEQYISFAGDDLLSDGGALKLGTKNIQSGGNVYAREAGGLLNLLGGGDSRGGDSKARGGNKNMNYNDFSRGYFGPNAIIDASNSNRQKGGNTKSGSGGGSGPGGAGGKLSLSLPPMPMKHKRSLAQQEVYQRNALPIPRALEARGAWMLELERRAAKAEAEAEAETEAEAEFEEEGLWAREAEAKADPEAEVFDYEEV